MAITGEGFIAWFNGLGLAYKFTVVLGALIVLVVLAAIIKLIVDKAILRKHIKREKKIKEAKANGYTEEIAIKRLSSMEEGELFGVRAIQSGFYGGVAQSAPSSPMGSRAPSLYNQPVSPSGPLNGSSPYLPLMHPQAAASPMASTTSLPLTRSPLGLNPVKGDGQPYSPNGPPSPVPSAMLRDTQRPGTSGSNRGFDRPPMHGRQESGQSSRTINLDGLAPARSQPAGSSSLRPSASDASNTSPPSTKNGTSHGSRSSSFTSTYSFEEGTEQQPQNPKIVRPFEGLPTLPVLQPLTAEVHNADSRRPSPSPGPQGHTSPPSRYNMTAELPTDLQRSPPRETNFSTPFRRPSQPENVIPPLSPGFGRLPAAAMNGGPQQFGPRTQSPGPMNRGPPPQRNESPGPFPMRGSSAAGPVPRTMSPGPRNQMPPRQGSGPRGPDMNRQQGDAYGQRRGPPAPLQFEPHQNKQPSLPAFLQQDGFNTTELDMPRYATNEPRSAPPTKTSSSHLMPQVPKKNRLTADILNDFYDSYSYSRNSKDDLSLNQHSNQHFEMHRMQEPTSLPGSPRQEYRQHPMDRRLV